MIIACVQITLTLVDKWPHASNTYSLWMQMQSWSFSAHLKHTHMLTNHTEIQNHLTRKYEKLATRIVQLAKYELNWTRKLKSQLAHLNSQLATCNSQLAEYLDPFESMPNACQNFCCISFITYTSITIYFFPSSSMNIVTRKSAFLILLDRFLSPCQHKRG